MTDYNELVKALLIHADTVTLDCSSCSYLDDCQTDGSGSYKMVDDAAAAIEELQAQLPKRGEWIDRYDEDDKPFFKRKYVCSACGGWNTYGKSKYCPNCGAKMEVQE